MAAPETSRVPAGRLRSAARGTLGLIIAVLAVYTAGFGLIDEIYQRTVTVGLSAALVLLAAPLRPGPSSSVAVRTAARAVDAALMAAIVVATLWFFVVYEELESGLYTFTPLDQAVAAGGLVAILELTRRLFGLPLVIFGVLAIVYSLFGARLPWIFAHAGFDLEETLRTMWYSFDGVFGRPVSVVVSLILVFIVFGVMLEGTGAGRTLLKFAFSLTGGLRGGPAHAAVVASALFGTISGSVAGNVVGTGVFTIPMIRRRGFSAVFAGAVEAAASSGGQFMPPVMGAVAFMMADLTGIPYLTIAVAALLPAVFYYFSLFSSVSVEAARLGIKPVPRAERERLDRRDWLHSLMFIIPIAVILGVLIAGRSAAMAGFWATLVAVAVGFLNPELRRAPDRLVPTLARAGEAGARIMVAVAMIGILIGAMNMTGLGIRFSMLVLSFAGDSLFVALVLLALGCLVLGMGMPTVPAYLIIVLVMGPAIQDLGVPILHTHLFVVYFGVLSSITPPVAIAAYAAAPISGGNPMTTAVVAVRLAAIGFIIPFVLVYNPSLVLVEGFEWGAFLWVTARLGLAIWLFATGFGGVERRPLGPVSRAARLASGVAMLVPGLPWETAGFILGSALVAYPWWADRRAASAEKARRGGET